MQGLQPPAEQRVASREAYSNIQRSFGYQTGAVVKFVHSYMRDVPHMFWPANWTGEMTRVAERSIERGTLYQIIGANEHGIRLEGTTFTWPFWCLALCDARGEIQRREYGVMGLDSLAQKVCLGPPPATSVFAGDWAVAGDGEEMVFDWEVDAPPEPVDPADIPHDLAEAMERFERNQRQAQARDRARREQERQGGIQRRARIPNPFRR